MVEIGLIAAWTTSGSPLVIPPSRPPARLVSRYQPALFRPEDLVVCLGAGLARDLPRLAERDALHGLDRADAPGRAARRASRSTTRATRPRERGRRRGPRTCRPATRSPSAAGRSRRPSPRRRLDRGSGRASRRRPRSPRARGRRAPARDTEAIWTTWLWTLTPTARGSPARSSPRRPAPRSRARWRARARCGRPGGRTSSAPARSAWPGRGRCDSSTSRLDRPGVHPLLPVRVVAVGDQDRDRAAQGAPVADPGADLDRVALDLHPAAAAMAELAARHVAVERLAIELEPGRQALDDRDQPGAVRFARCREPQSHAGSVDGARTRSRSGRCAGSQSRDTIATSAPSARNGAKGMVRVRALQPWRTSSANPATDPAAKEMTMASITPAPR